MVIGPSQVHVFAIDLDAPFSDDLLDDDERARAARFVFERDRRYFAAAHAGLRRVLAAALESAPGDLRFGVSDRGKPRLVHPTVPDLRFNLSHSGHLALVALTIGRDIGVDVEAERAVDVMALASRFFSASEARTLEQLPDRERVPAFFRCWTRKEAFVKAHGDGLSYGLDRFSVNIDDGPLDQALLSCDDAGDAARGWRIRPLSVPAGFSAAVAVEGTEWVLVDHSLHRHDRDERAASRG